MVGWISLCLVVLAPSLASADKAVFSFHVLKDEARRLAEGPYVWPGDDLPPVLKNLSYVQHREIEFRREATLFAEKGLPFQAQMYHRGWMSRDHVDLYLIDRDTGEAGRFGYDPALFNFRNAPIVPGDASLRPELGFAGLKLLAPLNRPADQPYDEVASFLGASYYRAIGRGQVYGTSARGIAIDTLLPDRSEEFPAFTRLYLERPRLGDKTVTVYALLDGPAVTGAYRFDITPGDDTTVNVEANLYFRHGVSELGLAPLTSMYQFGENDRDSGHNDYRPEVHDTDGLLIRDADHGDTWRPLVNPDEPLSTFYPVDRLVGFGLMQRDRDYDHYQDDEAAYHRRPSTWVQFEAPAEAGAVRLVELPTPNEFMDNIVAYWRPNVLPGAGESLTLHYRVTFTTHPLAGDETSESSETAHITATRFDRTTPDELRVLIDFTGPALSPRVRPVLDGAPPGAAHSVTWMPTSMEQTWRLSFVIGNPADPPHDLRIRLMDGDRAVSETWRPTWK